MTQLKRSQPSLQLHQPLIRDEIKIEDGTPEKPSVEIIEGELLSDSDEIDEEDNEKGEACATMILNSLLL
jgi:hypothetical protein